MRVVLVQGMVAWAHSLVEPELLHLAGVLYQVWVLRAKMGGLPSQEDFLPERVSPGARRCRGRSLRRAGE